MHSDPGNMCSPLDGERRAPSQQPTRRATLCPSCSCPPPAPNPGPPSGRGRSRTSTWAAEASHSCQGSSKSIPIGTISGVERRIQPLQSMHCPGITSRGRAERGRREHLAVYSPVLSTEISSQRLLAASRRQVPGTAVCPATAQAPSAHPSATDFAPVGKDPCYSGLQLTTGACHCCRTDAPGGAYTGLSRSFLDSFPPPQE